MHVKLRALPQNNCHYIILRAPNKNTKQIEIYMQLTFVKNKKDRCHTEDNSGKATRCLYFYNALHTSNIHICIHTHARVHTHTHTKCSLIILKLKIQTKYYIK